MDSLQLSEPKPVSSGDEVRFPIDAYLEIQDANYRDYSDPEIVATIRRIADAYKRGEAVQTIVACVIDGKPYVVDGVLRLRGAKLAVSEIVTWRDAEVVTFGAIINQSCENHFRHLLSKQ